MSLDDATTQVSALAVKVLQSCTLRHGTPFFLGLSGLQGSGKSTLAQAVLQAAQARGLTAVAFSLDDFYLTRSERVALSGAVHRLLITRGVPGTHDTAMLANVLDQLRSGMLPVAIPRFDKAHDDRCQAAAWQQVNVRPALVIVEGWCVGVTAEPDVALATPRNALERDEDADGRWRGWVNRQLAVYAAIWARLDRLVVLGAPDWSVVERWRRQAELPLRQRGAPAAMDDAQLTRFLEHYERISRHALVTLPAHADAWIELDAQRNANYRDNNAS
jgi:D-glycerate 3-kinase